MYILSCIDVTKECYQIGLSSEVLLFFSSLVVKLSSEDLFGYIPTTPMQQRKTYFLAFNSHHPTKEILHGKMCKIKANKKPHQK